MLKDNRLGLCQFIYLSFVTKMLAINICKYIFEVGHRVCFKEASV